MTVCRVCERPLTDTILDLGSKPLANDFRDDPDDGGGCYPLVVMLCTSCGTVQLRDGVPPEWLFGGDYAYQSSVNFPYVRQCHAVADRLTFDLALGPDDLVVEIGSNDGYLLSRYVEHGVRVLGYEPAGNLAEIAKERGVATHCGFFSVTSGGHFEGGHRKARIVHANNVLAHAPDINGILAGISRCLEPDGLLVVENPHLMPLVDRNLYDTVYFEHLFYWTATAFNRACRRAGLALVDVEELESHGGSLRMWVAHQGARQPTAAVEAAFRSERAHGLTDPARFAGLQTAVDEHTKTTRDKLVEIRDAGLSIAGYGAAAKGTMLLNALDLPEGTLDYVIDATPGKIGRYMPGVRVPVVAPTRLDEDPPDVIVVLAWNWAEAIISQHPDFAGRWMTPMPQLADIN